MNRFSINIFQQTTSWTCFSNRSLRIILFIEETKASILTHYDSEHRQITLIRLMYVENVLNREWALQLMRERRLRKTKAFSDWDNGGHRFVVSEAQKLKKHSIRVEFFPRFTPWPPWRLFSDTHPGAKRP